MVIGKLKCPLCGKSATYKHNLVTHLKGQLPYGHGLAEDVAKKLASETARGTQHGFVSSSHEYECRIPSVDEQKPLMQPIENTLRNTKMSIRKALAWDSGYEMICREERNLAAIFYHVLLLPDNLQQFLRLVGHAVPADLSEVAVFYEYAYLRDLWYKHSQSNDMRKIILDLIDPPNRDELERMNIFDFNNFFGAVPRPSYDFIQSPSNWSISRFKNNIPDNSFFSKVCRFKWSFNAKPDIVIHTAQNSAVCIEAKCESGEGRYPSNPEEIREFNKRGLSVVRQTELQAYLMEELLGINTKFIYLVQQPYAASDKHLILTWRQAFECMDTTSCLPFARDWIKRL